MLLAKRVCPSAVAARSVAARPSRQIARPVRPARFIARSSPQEVEKKIEDALKEAEEVCADGTAQDCAVAWDTVEELSAAASHIKAAASAAPVDPLEQFCAENADADECRVYED